MYIYFTLSSENINIYCATKTLLQSANKTFNIDNNIKGVNFLN